MDNKYIPLYRKYRPAKFADLVGQEHIAKTLSNAINANRIAHAYLFTGPRGTGKTSSARIFAKSLNCLEGPTVDPCEKCANCIDLSNGVSMDVIEIDAASNRKVEDARNILEKVQFVPASGKFKIYIIDEVHMLTTEAFNTLLKTLEEPPENLIFILATTEPHKVLDTIISRCQRFDFRRIKTDDIFNRLKYVTEQENIKITDEAITLISRRSSGGLRDALALLDQSSILAVDDKAIEGKDIHTLLGSISDEELHKIAEIISKKDAKQLVPLIHELVQSGNEPLQIIKELMKYFRNLMLVKTCNNLDEAAKIMDISTQLCGLIKEQSKTFEITEIAQIIEKLSENERNIRTSTDQYLWLEVALISITHRADIQLIKDLEARIVNLEEAISGGEIKVSAQVAPPQQVNKPVAEVAPKPQVQQPPKNSYKEEAKSIDKPKSQVVNEQLKPEPIIEKSEDANVIESNQPKQQETAAPAQVTGNASWAQLLENIESIPSRMMLNNLANPVEISSERIIITFSVEAFVKQAQDGSKKRPLENAAKKLFGKIPQIIIRTPLPEDEKKNLNNAKIDINKQEINPQQPKETSLAAESKTSFNQVEAQVVVEKSEKTKPQIDKQEVKSANNELDNLENKVMEATLSEQAKTVIDLFQGKII